MSNPRRIVFRNEYIYHIFNRGIEKRPTFKDIREFNRTLKLLKFYRHKEIPTRFSQVIQQPEEIRSRILQDIYRSEKIVEILCYCLMPNHFHLILKQKCDSGITKFMSNFTNAYTKYFNTKNKRVGPLFQGIFKSVIVEDDEQLMHLTRYVHLNPFTSSLVTIDKIENYIWSSYPEYLYPTEYKITDNALILEMFKSIDMYKHFVLDEADYFKKIDKIKHLTLE